MHRSKAIYGLDAREFRPERWEHDALKGVGYGYLPFGAGPRACLGQDFALMEATYTVARLVQRYPYMSVSDGQTLEVGKEKQLLTLVLASAEGCCLRLSETDNL
jgi:cytochrome P450